MSVTPSPVAGPERPLEAPETERMRRWRVVLIALGVGLLVIAAVTLLNDIAPSRYLGIAVWLVGALIIHDGIAAMIVFGVAVLLRRTGDRIPFAVLAIVQGAIVVAVIVSVLFIPEIIKKHIGTANPTVLPLDYLLNLGVFYVVLAAVTAGAIVLCLRMLKRREADQQESSERG